MIVSWNTTNACNLSCRHCYRDAGVKAEEELGTGEGLGLIDEIARAGFKIMIFSGGEPLMREDILDLVAHAVKKGLRPVFGTNGTLIDGRTAARLKSSGAAAMGISLDSVDQEKHDRFRGVTGAWRGAVDGMAACRREGLPFQVHTTVVDWNYEEIEEITDFAVRAGAVAHHVFFLVPAGRGADIESESLRAERYERLLERIMAKQRLVDIELKPTCAPQFMRIARQMGVDTRFSRGCLAGTAYCIISPVGNVQPCAYLDISAGNVRERPFSEIWRDNPVFNRLRTMEYGGGCGVCNYRKICGGCRARALYYHGDYMAEEPWCLYRSSVVGRRSSENDQIKKAEG
ncbi:MAG: putative heme d1 biosynthesis radical SAM protein NirJ2 [Peptococcaceae bacterium]|nr:putative heme d1 biosynthesis radical SAM protein NirJ2 [Peptococcaceae bacterium]